MIRDGGREGRPSRHTLEGVAPSLEKPLGRGIVSRDHFQLALVAGAIRRPCTTTRAPPAIPAPRRAALAPRRIRPSIARESDRAPLSDVARDRSSVGSLSSARSAVSASTWIPPHVHREPYRAIEAHAADRRCAGRIRSACSLSRLFAPTGPGCSLPRSSPARVASARSSPLSSNSEWPSTSRSRISSTPIYRRCS